MTRTRIRTRAIKLLSALALLISLSAIPSFAQSGYVNVTATVVDTNGSKYANAPYRVTFIDPGTSGKLPLLSGSTFQQSYAGYATDGNGVLHISLPDNNLIASTSGATGTQWTFSICTAVGAYTTVYCIPSTSITITGASQDISAILTPVAPILPINSGGGPLLQTNSLANTVQSTLNLKQGTNVTITSDNLGGVTINSNGGSIPPANYQTIQVNGASQSPQPKLNFTPTPTAAVTCSNNVINSSTDCGVAFTAAVPQLSTDNTWTNSNRFKGPIPFADITAFGARQSPFGGISGPTTTATCTISLTTCTFASVANFIIGDGVTIRGAGATLAIATPSTSGFTVTPSVSSVGMGLGGGNYASITTVPSATAASTYSYILIGRDKVGGYTAPSSAVTISTGQAALGAATCAVSTATRSGLLNTITFTAPCVGAVVGAVMRFFGSTSSTFSGYYSIETVNSPSQIVVSGQYNSNSFGWQSGDSTQNSATGGTATFLLSNHLRWTLGTGVWQYYVCAERPGDSSYKRIGITKPNTTIGEDVQFDDYGSPYNDSQIYPAYITDSLCNGGAKQDDPLTTTITNIAGNTVTLAAPVINSTSGTTVNFDDAPAILAAMNSVNTFTSGTVIIPWTESNKPFIINSYFTVPAGISVNQIGQLATNETVQTTGSSTWDGSGANNGIGQFTYDSGGSATWNVLGVPGIYNPSDGFDLKNVTLTISGNVNGGLIELDDAFHVQRENVQYRLGGGTSDYLSMAILYRGTLSSEDSILDLSRSYIQYGSPSLTTWTPFIYVQAPQTSSGTLGTNQFARINISGTDMSMRGFIQTSVASFSQWKLDNITRQGGISPLLWIYSTNRVGAQVDIDNVIQDTDTEGAVVIGNQFGIPSLSLLDLTVKNLQNGSADIGGVAPPFSGFAPREIEQRYNATGRMPNSTGYGTCPNTTSSTGIWYKCNYDPILFNGPNAHIFFPLTAPAAPTATPAPGGFLPAGNFQAAITAVGVDGNETILSPLSGITATSGTCIGSGNCTLSLSWAAVTGAVSYNIYGCGPSNPTCPTINKQGSSATNSFSWTSLGSNGATPVITLTGISGHNAAMAWAPLFTCPETTAPNGIAGFDVIYCDSSTHRLSVRNNNGTSQALGYLSEITAANSFSLLGSGTNSNAGLYTASGNSWDFHLALHTNMFVSGLTAAKPATCSVGEEYFSTDATAGQNLFYCTATNVWTQQLNSGAAGASTSLGNLIGTAINQDLVPDAINSRALGNSTIPWTNTFWGISTTQRFSWTGVTSLTGIRTAFVPDANSSLIVACPAVTNQFIISLSISTGGCTQSLISASAASVPSYLADSGSSTAYVVTLSPAIISYAAGLTIRFKPANNNTITTPTLNVNGISAVTVTKYGNVALTIADLCTTTIAQVTYDGVNWELNNPCTASGYTTAGSSKTLTNTIIDAESTGNTISEPVRLMISAAGCNSGVNPGAGFATGASNTPNVICTGSPIPEGVAQFARGNIGWLNNIIVFPDWNNSHNVDITVCYNTTDTTNGHVTAFNIQTGFNKVDGTQTDQPSLNTAQTLTSTIGASQVSGGEICSSLSNITMTGANPGYNWIVQITRNNSGVDTNTDTAVAIKTFMLTMGVSKNAANR